MAGWALRLEAEHMHSMRPCILLSMSARLLHSHLMNKQALSCTRFEYVC